MKILVIGSGGREHAMAWRLAQSPKVSRVYVAPGNAGTAREDGVFNVDITGIPELLEFAQREGIEEFMQGEGASVIVMVDGKNVLPLASTQDHKRIFDGDKGPNTGGMGAYSPAPVVTPEVHARAMREIVLPTVKCMAADGVPYV